MKILIIGSGGREHALAWRINNDFNLFEINRDNRSLEMNSIPPQPYHQPLTGQDINTQSPNILYIANGNPGTEQIGINVKININSNKEVLDFCSTERIDLVVVGPEQPLVNGLTDLLRSNKIKVFGPSKEAARIESDKSYAKNLMQKYGIPTAQYKIFFRSELSEASNYLISTKYPLVVKANGLAAGKGVLIVKCYEEALEAINSIFVDNVFGEAGNSVVLEEFLEGEEASLFIITDGEKYIILPAAQDHKRIGEEDTGKNTGGMGSYAPTPIVTTDTLSEIEHNIIIPILKALRTENNPFNGCLYAGLMLTANGAKVIEFNCRFGDPETQVVLPLIEGNFTQLLYSAASGDLVTSSVRYNGGAAVCVVLASNGYPDDYTAGFPIEGLNLLDNKTEIAFHAGTKNLQFKSNTNDSKRIVTNGGRVIGITATSQENNLLSCIENAYKAVSKIHFENIYFRRDIGKRVEKYLAN